MSIPGYPKVITLGSQHTENTFQGNVVIQEKVDGSQLKWGIDDNKKLIISSKNNIVYDANTGILVPQDNMFYKACHYLMGVQKTINVNFPPNTWFYGEYLQKPKHNTLTYNRIPKNNIMLFDAIVEGKWLSCIPSNDELSSLAALINVEPVNIIYYGSMTKEQFKHTVDSWLKTESILGGENIEGVVIKNYDQLLNVFGKLWPLFTKYVSDKFKEKNNKEWAGAKSNSVQDFVQSFKSEARWEKARQHLRDEGKLVNELKDIGSLMKEVNRDILEEEKDFIKNKLFKLFWRKISRNATKGLPEWYREKLFEENVD